MIVNVNGLYRTRCGAIIHFKGTIHNGVQIEHACELCGQYPCGPGWSYSRDGKWVRGDTLTPHHLDLKEEILP